MTLNELPWKFEAGTPNIADAVGLGAAVKYLQGVGKENILSHEEDVTRYAMKRIGECKKVTVYGPEDAAKKCGIIPSALKAYRHTMLLCSVITMAPHFAATTTMHNHCTKSSNLSPQPGLASIFTTQKK